MGRKSSIDKLPKELREELIQLLKNPAVTQADITKLINETAGKNVVSKSAVNRYAKRMESMIEKTRQAQAVADIYLKEVGDDTRNKLGKIINERVRMLAFDLTDDLMAIRENVDADEEIDHKQIAEIIQKVSRAVKELEQAEKLNAEREARIRKDAMEEAAATAEKELKDQGVEESAIVTLKKTLLGLS